MKLMNGNESVPAGILCGDGRVCCRRKKIRSVKK